MSIKNGVEFLLHGQKSFKARQKLFVDGPLARVGNLLVNTTVSSYLASTWHHTTLHANTFIKLQTLIT